MVLYSQTSPVLVAYNSLIKMISDGEIKLGAHLPALELAERFGMSRTPVLEALKRLENEGVVVFKSGNGAWLVDITVDEVKELYVVRKELEVLSLKLFIDRISTQDLIEMRKFAFLETEYFKAGDKIGTIKSGLDFHQALHSHCPNRYLVQSINRILSTNFIYLVMLEHALGESDKTHPEDHGILADLIAEKKFEQAIDFLGRHVDLAFKLDISRQ